MSLYSIIVINDVGYTPFNSKVIAVKYNLVVIM